MKYKSNVKIVKYNDGYYLYPSEKKFKRICLAAPKIFSFFDNWEENLSYFDMVRQICKCKNFEKNLIFDLLTVEKISIDVIMYMVAFVKSDDHKNIHFSLTIPTKTQCKKFINECGLGQFMQDKQVFSGNCKNYYTIMFGSKADTGIAKEICDFVYSKLNIDKSEGYFFYNMLIELMNNTEQHAYNKNEKKIWYIFIENTKNKLKFTFLDTGKGIPTTIVIKNKFLVGTNNYSNLSFVDILDSFFEKDSKLIFSALKSKSKRTKTKKANRGRGLPEIYNYYKYDKYTSRLKIISRKGMCIFKDSKRNLPEMINLDIAFNGTLFYWEIKKSRFKKRSDIECF